MILRRHFKSRMNHPIESKCGPIKIVRGADRRVTARTLQSNISPHQGKARDRLQLTDLEQGEIIGNDSPCSAVFLRRNGVMGIGFVRIQTATLFILLLMIVPACHAGSSSNTRSGSERVIFSTEEDTN